MDWTKKKCVSCEGGIKAYSANEVAERVREFPEWAASDDGDSITTSFKVKNFLDAVNFIRQVAEIAEEEGHHPDIHLTSYRNLRVDLSTHAIGGVSDNDFILAAKINALRNKTT